MATSYSDRGQNDELERRLNKPESSHLRRDFDPELFHEYDAEAVAEREREYRKNLARRIGITITKMEAHLEGNNHVQKL